MDSVLVNFELKRGNYQAEEASNTSEAQPDLLRFSQADEIDCKIVELALMIPIVTNNLIEHASR